jgi:hypothetical protein
MIALVVAGHLPAAALGKLEQTPRKEAQELHFSSMGSMHEDAKFGCDVLFESAVASSL